MLSKQSWRIPNNLDSLIAQVLKYKYFLRVQSINAKLGPRPSFVWRSLIAGHTLLKEGLAWRIGNIQKVIIWEDRCLPLPHSLLLLAPSMANDVFKLVADLIDAYKRLGGMMPFQICSSH